MSLQRNYEFEGETLEAASAAALSGLRHLSPVARSALVEIVQEPGAPIVSRASGKTIEEAEKNATYSLRGLAKVVGTRTIHEADEKVVEFEADSYEDAKDLAEEFVPKGYVRDSPTDIKSGSGVEIVQNSKPGFLGFGKIRGRYTIVCTRPAMVEIEYLKPFKLIYSLRRGSADPIHAVIENAFATVLGAGGNSSQADVQGLRREVAGVVCIECPKCGTDFKRQLVLAEIRRQSPFVFEFQNWSTGFVCQVCRVNIRISSSSDD